MRCVTQLNAAVGANRVWYNLDIVGSTGRTLGRVRVGARVAKTMDKLPLWHTTDNQHMEADSAPVRVEDAADQLNVQQQLQQQKKNSLLADPREDAAAVLQAASEEVSPHADLLPRCTAQPLALG